MSIADLTGARICWSRGKLRSSLCLSLRLIQKKSEAVRGSFCVETRSVCCAACIGRYAGVSLHCKTSADCSSCNRSGRVPLKRGCKLLPRQSGSTRASGSSAKRCCVFFQVMNLVDMRQIFALLRESAWFCPAGRICRQAKKMPRKKLTAGNFLLWLLSYFFCLSEA